MLANGFNAESETDWCRLEPHPRMGNPVLSPNQLELDSFSGRKPQSLFDCLAMARALLVRGPKAVLVKHLD